MSYFRENIDRLEGYTPGFQPAAGDVVKLNTNENPYSPSPKVLEAIKNISTEKLRRYPQPLGDTFRQSAAKVLGVSADNIMCTNGGDELLNMCLRAFCDENRPVAYPVPTYSLYPVLAGAQNCPVVEADLYAEDVLCSLADAKAALTILCNPNAPTCGVIPVEKVAELAGSVKGVLLVDEAYVDFAEDNCVRLVKDFDNVIVLRSLSKGYSLAGLRFGFGIAEAALIQGLLKVKDSYNVDAVAIAAATAAVEDQKYFKNSVEKIKASRAVLIQQLRDIGFEVPESSTNFVLARHGRAEEIFNKLVEQNIYVRYFRLPGLDDKLRITVGTAQQNEKLIGVLKRIL